MLNTLSFKKSLRSIRLLSAAAISGNAAAADFFSTEPPTRTFDFGARLGVNSSNQTFNKHAFPAWNVNSWGTGMEAGFVADLNIRDYLTIQPGIFYESRSGNYAYSQYFYNNDGEKSDFTQLGHYRSFNFNIPLMVSLRFNLSDNLRWLAEAGPYIQWRFHDTGNGKIQVIAPQSSPSAPVDVRSSESNNFDFGLKIGTGFTLNERYSILIHYMAGAKKVWKTPLAGGHNKAWLFTVGYTL